MVTAIVVPIICIYFIWLTQKEMKQQKAKWLELEHVPEEAVLVGKIKEVKEEKQRFYYHYYIQVTLLTLQTEQKVIRVKKISPYAKETNPFPYKPGDEVKVYGNWKEEFFRIGRIEKYN